MKVYRPVPVAAAGDVLAPSLGLDAIEQIGIVDDRLDPHLIDGVVEGLARLLPAAMVRVWEKPVGTSPAPDALIEEVASEVQVALSGVGM